MMPGLEDSDVLSGGGRVLRKDGTMTITLRCVTALAAVTTVYALSIAPVAAAYPGDPMPGCITQMGSVLCDGPIRPDGT